MHYVPEFYYFYNQPGSLLAEAIRVTATHLAQFCTQYEAKLIAPNKGVLITEKHGELPTSPAEKAHFVAELIQWFTSNSEFPDLFCLRLYNEPRNPQECAIFDHSDDTCCWVLNISEIQFTSLQHAWQEAGLPHDLFYPENKTTVVSKPLGWFGRVLTRLGFSFTGGHHYTPKQWTEKMSRAVISTELLTEKNIPTAITMAQIIFNSSPKEAATYLNPIDWKQKIKDGALLFGATVDTIPAGFVFAYPTKAKRLHIWHAGVLPEYRGLKIWSQLYQTIETKARELGYNEITLHTYPDRFPEMYNFAQKNGFMSYSPNKTSEFEKKYLLKSL